MNLLLESQNPMRETVNPLGLALSQKVILLIDMIKFCTV